jgi:hypothetical protein
MAINQITRDAALGAVGQLLAGLDRAYTGFSEVIDAVETAATTLKTQLDDFSHFDFDPKFATRVMNGKFAVGGAESLWDDIKSIFSVKLIQMLREAENTVQALKNIPPRAPGEPLLQRTALILNEIHAFNTDLAARITSLLDFTQVIDDIKHRIETLDDLFLPQSSQRTPTTLRYRKRS